MLHKSFRGHADVKSIDEGLAEIVVSAYGNVDHDGDIVVKGAAAKQIAGEYGPNPKGFLDHSNSMLHAVAKTLRWWEEDDGTHIKAQYNLEKQIGRDAFSDLKFYGDDMEFSVGYSIKNAQRPTDEQKALGAKQIITEWQINEWSHVWLGANSETRLVGAKSFADRLDALEQRVGITVNIHGDGLNSQEVADLVAEKAKDAATLDVSEEDAAFLDDRKIALDETGDEPKALDPLTVAKFRLLVASTRT